jgi:hypothetical protein
MRVQLHGQDIEGTLEYSSSTIPLMQTKFILNCVKIPTKEMLECTIPLRSVVKIQNLRIN